ncbi:MAG TPA: aminoacyl-tRNA hydrolase [bacterium]|nr:aminoacyl-tRNA hydrolase [bacterium]
MAPSLAVIGLGNPGDEYRNTRHNVGFMVCDQLAEEFRSDFRKKGLFDFFRKGNLIVVKSLTFMNETGKAVTHLRNKFPFDISFLLAVADDFNLSLGKIRYRVSGSDGGHNGLASIIENAGTQEFPRLRLGIGPLPENFPAEKFVLSSFSKQERETVKSMVSGAAELILSWTHSGLPGSNTTFDAGNIQ